MVLHWPEGDTLHILSCNGVVPGFWQSLAKGVIIGQKGLLNGI